MVTLFIICIIVTQKRLTLNEIKRKKLKTILKQIEDESTKLLEGDDSNDVVEIIFEISYKMYETEMTKYYIRNFIENKNNVIEIKK